jgi:hypothetical protein
MLDADAVAERMARCRCPVETVEVAGVTVVNHLHRHGCEALRR